MPNARDTDAARKIMLSLRCIQSTCVCNGSLFLPWDKKKIENWDFLIFLFFSQNSGNIKVFIFYNSRFISHNSEKSQNSEFYTQNCKNKTCISQKNESELQMPTQF